MVDVIYYAHDIRVKADSTYHQHDYWQLEIIVRGPIAFYANERIIYPSEGQVILIPPRCSHSFCYEEDGCEYYSIKFESNTGIAADQVIFLPDSGNEAVLANALKEYLAGRDFLSGKDAGVAETLIDGIMKQCVIEDIEECPLVSTALEFIADNILIPLTVSELAVAAGCSTSGLTRKFREQTGLSPKEYIDRERGNLLKSYLQHSSLSQMAIAEKMNFPDVYTFAKFCKRVNGESPGAIRQSVYKKIDRPD